MSHKIDYDEQVYDIGKGLCAGLFFFYWNYMLDPSLFGSFVQIVLKLYSAHLIFLHCRLAQMDTDGPSNLNNLSYTIFGDFIS